MPSDAHRGSRLHPVSVLVGVPLVQIVRALVIPAFAVLAGGPGDRTPLLVLVILSVLLGLRVLAWQRFTWSFDGEVVRVEQGVLSRSRRVVDVERVQQVELDRPFVQRLLGVATLRIETAGSDAGPEVELRVLGLADALTLRAALQPRPAVGPPDGTDRAEDDGTSAGAGAGAGAAPTSAPEPTVLLRLPLGRVALAAVTGAQLLLAPALLTGLLQLTGDRTDELIDAFVAWLGELQAGSAAPGARTWLLGTVAIVVVALATTLTVSVVRDGGFVVLRRGDDLILRRGLLGTRESTVPLRRVQVVRVAANPLRRALGVASLRIHSAGGSAGGAGGDRRAVIPLVSRDELPDLLASLLPALDGLPALLPHPPAARRRALLRRLRGLGSWLIPAIVVWVLMARDPDAIAASPLPLPDAVLALLARDGAAWTVPLLVAGTLVLVQSLLAHLEHAALGHASDAHVVVARTGALSHVLSVAPLARLQGVTHRVSWFQARRDLATVRAHVAGPGGDVLVLDAAGDDARRLRSRLADAASGAGTG
jgi:putative membrane protein